MRVISAKLYSIIAVFTIFRKIATNEMIQVVMSIIDRSFVSSERKRNDKPKRFATDSFLEASQDFGKRKNFPTYFSVFWGGKRGLMV